MLSSEEISQLFMFGFPGRRFDEALRDWLSEMRPGGIIHFARNAGTPHEVQALNGGFAVAARELGIEPLLIACDQEGGIVNRLTSGFTVFPGNMAIGSIYASDPALGMTLCEAAASATASQMKAVGFNVNLAPCIDVVSNRLNPTVGTRSFSDRPEVVGLLGGAAAKGFAAGGVLATAKHFPGHGDTPVDSHTGLPSAALTPSYVMTHVAPFRALISQGVPIVMPAHIAFKSGGGQPGLPATLSRDILTGYLRRELGFSGLIITDCMEMGAIAGTFGTAPAAVKALSAGADMVLVSHTLAVQRESVRMVREALHDGRLGERELRAKLRRIRAAKEIAGMVAARDVSLCGSPGYEALSKEIAEKSITLLKRDFVPARGDRMLVIGPEQYGSTLVEDAESSPLLASIRAMGRTPQVITYKKQVDDATRAAAVEAAATADWVLFASNGIVINESQAVLAKDVLAACRQFALLAIGAPYDAALVPDAQTIVLSFGYAPCQISAALRVLFGAPATGRLPVAIKG